MHNENHEFDKLLKLLALKRFEKPPAGYFDNFSARVIQKIDSLENPQDQTGESFLIQLWRMLISKPAFAGIFAVALIAIAIVVMRPAQTAEIPGRSSFSHKNPWELNVETRNDNELATLPGVASSQSSDHSSTNPVTPQTGTPSLFQQIPTLINPTPAGYAPRQ